MKYGGVIILLLLFNNFFSQENATNGYFALKIRADYYKDDDASRLLNGNPPKTGPSNCPHGKDIILIQKNKTEIYPGLEIAYYFPKSRYCRSFLGLSYSYSKTYYHYESIDRITHNYQQFSLLRGSGSGILRNNMCKLVLGFYFPSNSGLNFFVQPLNPEIRFIKSGATSITEEKYDGYYSSQRSYCSFHDSVTVLVGAEQKTEQFHNYKTKVNFSISFPTVLGIEQKFKIKKNSYVVGAALLARS